MTPIEQAALTPTVVVPAQRPASSVAPATPPSAAVPAVPLFAAPRLKLVTTVLAALVCGVLGLLVTPVLLGPAAIAGGLAGEYLGRRGSNKVAAAALLALTVAALVAAAILI